MYICSHACDLYKYVLWMEWCPSKGHYVEIQAPNVMAVGNGDFGDN